MSLVPAVTELILAELLYLQYDNPSRPVYMYINSAGVTVSRLQQYQQQPMYSVPYLPTCMVYVAAQEHQDSSQIQHVHADHNNGLTCILCITA